MLKVAFDLDETLGVPLIDGAVMAGWVYRTGCRELLSALSGRVRLCLWTVSPRRYLDKALKAGLNEWFVEAYSWDEMPGEWKDVRRIGAAFLVDDSPHHRQMGAKHGIEGAYIVVPAFGGPEDMRDPLSWVRLVQEAIEL